MHAHFAALVYNMLYENVFKIPNVESIVQGMLYGKEFVSPHFHEINNNNKAEEGECNKGSQLIAPFPFKVAKALDPSIYRNIEYDSWTEVRRGMFYSFLYSMLFFISQVIKLSNNK